MNKKKKKKIQDLPYYSIFEPQKLKCPEKFIGKRLIILSFY